MVLVKTVPFLVDGRAFDAFFAHLFGEGILLFMVHVYWASNYKKYDDATIECILSPVLSVSLAPSGVVAFRANCESHSEH